MNPKAREMRGQTRNLQQPDLSVSRIHDNGGDLRIAAIVFTFYKEVTSLIHHPPRLRTQRLQNHLFVALHPRVVVEVHPAAGVVDPLQDWLPQMPAGIVH